jgi:hypothetical protein
MSTSFVYHAFGAITYKYLSTEYRQGKIFLHMEKKKDYPALLTRILNCPDFSTSLWRCVLVFQTVLL